MNDSGKLIKRVWLIIVVFPLVMAVFAYSSFPAGVQLVPPHWDFSGNVTGYASPSFVFVLGAIMAANNGLLAFCYFKSDRLYELGLVNGTDAPGARKVLLVTGIIIIVVTAAIFVAIVTSA